MKTLTFLFIPFFCFFTINLSAQFSVGLKAGYVDAWQNFGAADIPEDEDTHIHSFQISGLAYCKLNNWLEIGIEPGFVRRGAACEPGWFAFSGTPRRLHLNYLEMPILLKGNLLFFEDRMSLNAKIGLGAARTLSAYREMETWGEIVFVETTISKTGIKPWDFGTYGGLGISFDLGGIKIFSEARYYRSLGNAVAGTISGNRSLEYSLGYLRQF